MSSFKLPLSNDSTRRSIFTWIRQKLWVEKFYNLPGAALLLLASLGLGWIAIEVDLKLSFIILGGFIALPVLYAIVAKPQFGILTLLIMANLLFFILRFGVEFPLGTLLDGLQYLLILGFIIGQRSRPDWSVFKGPVSTMVLVWVSFNILQVLNPVADSRLAWVYTVRSAAIVVLMYFVFKYQIRTIQFIRVILKLWLFISVWAALLAYKQEYIGFSASEQAYLDSDPSIGSLLFIDGHWRKYGLFADPVIFSYNMVIASLICVALLTGPLTLWKKISLVVMIFLFISAMLFSGTRGAYVLLPAGLALFAILKFNRVILFFSLIAGFIMAVLIMIPTSNPTLYRFQTAFRPTNDASFNLRAQNQKKIQPFIQSHPIGGGLGAAGSWGKRFSPDSFLANIPPDGGYVRVAMETGWVGLLLLCTLVFLIIRAGIINFYRIKNPELKTYCLAMTLSVFVLNIGNYPQEALVQFPLNIYIYLMAALIDVTYRLDQKQQTTASKPLVVS